MNLDMQELRAITCCILEQKFITKLKLDYIENPAMAIVYEYLINHKDQVMTRNVEFVSSLTNVPSNYLEIFREESYKIKDSGMNIKDIFDESMTGILDRERLKLMMYRIDKAKQLITDGQETEAIMLLNSLRPETKRKIMPTANLLMTSMIETNGFSSGIVEIDKNEGGWLRGNMCTIFGDSGTQKTMISLWMMIKCLIANPMAHAVYFEKEMPVKDIGRRLLSFLLKRDSKELLNIAIGSSKEKELQAKFDEIVNELRTKLTDNDFIDITERLHIVSKHDFENFIDIWEIIESFKADIWCLDFATMLDPKNEDPEHYDLFMKRQFIMAKNVLDKTNSFGIVLSQLKQQSNIDIRKNKIPLIGDMEWGKYLRQLSYWVFALFYPAYYANTDGYKVDPRWIYLISRKSRNGSQIILPLKAYPEVCNYLEPDIAIRRDMEKYLKDYISHKKGER